MANPASTFPYDPNDPTYAQIAGMEPAPDELADLTMGGGGEPVDPSQVTPAQRVPESGGLQEQVIAGILQQLMTPPPKRKWYQNLPFMTPPNFATGRTSEEKDWEMRQQQAMRGVASLNSLTGMERLQQGDERIGIARDNAAMRERGLDQSDTRIGQRDRGLNRGAPIRIETTDSAGRPMTLAGWQLPPDAPGGGGIQLTDGSVIQPSAFPRPYQIFALEGAQGFNKFDPFTGTSSGLVTGPNGQPIQPKIPPGVQTQITTGGTLVNLLNTARSRFFSYARKTPLPTRLLMAAGRKVPLVGDTAVGYADPEANNVATSLKNIGDLLTRLRSGAQISMPELHNLEALIPGLATSEEDAALKFARFEQELMTRLRINAALSPAAFTEAALRAVGISRAELGLPPEPGGPYNPGAAQGNPFGLSPDEAQGLEVVP